jgi:hypothetical protein
MAPSEKKIIAELRAATLAVFSSPDKDKLSVRLVRDKTTSNLGLDEGFFLEREWKEKSKKLIKAYAVRHPHLQCHSTSIG